MTAPTPTPTFPPWSPSRAREELRAALGRAERELKKTPPPAPSRTKLAMVGNAKLRRALIEDRVVDDPEALLRELKEIGRIDAGLLALLKAHGVSMEPTAKKKEEPAK